VGNAAGQPTDGLHLLGLGQLCLKLLPLILRPFAVGDVFENTQDSVAFPGCVWQRHLCRINPQAIAVGLLQRLDDTKLGLVEGDNLMVILPVGIGFGVRPWQVIVRLSDRLFLRVQSGYSCERLVASQLNAVAVFPED
jgi:hypothetical protein